VWSHAAKFRLRIGPMGLAEYRRLAARGSPSFARLEAIVRNYTGDTLDWDLNLVLAQAEVPQARLGGGAAALGQTGWIGRRRKGGDADDLYLVPASLRRRRAAEAGDGKGRGR
jgi:type VI secretion system protein ImpH